MSAATAKRALLVAGAVLLSAAVLSAQGGLQGPPAPPSVQIDLGGGSDPQRLSTALEIVLFVTLLALAPAIVTTMTCFTRIIVVLSFLRRAMSVQELPPAIVVTGFSVFLTIFVMAPVFDDLKRDAYDPYVAEQIPFDEALDRAGLRMNEFMLAQTRDEDLALILELAQVARPDTPADVPFRVAVPAFVLSEVKTAFQMGFVLFLPFLAIDLFVSAILVSMGMFTLPPIIVSTPLKVLLFVLVDGWNLVVASLAQSFVQT